MSQILIVEDEPIIRSALRRLLERNGFSVVEAGSVDEALQLAADDFDLIIADLRLPGGSGTELIAQVGQVPVIIMTSYASVRSAVDAMKAGAFDYIAKPFDHDEMVVLVRRALNQSNLKRQNAALKSDLSRTYPVAGMVGECAAMREICAHIHKVAPTDASVLILGESGTGKELVARAVHEQSPRRDAPLVAVNCAAIPEGLLESELFGHEKGAFTGASGTRHGLVEAADGGTLFLDEIGELPLAAQARLLRVLQEGEIRRVGSTRVRKVNIRLIAATHRDLQQRVADGAFRGDLYFRLRVVEITLPPLRERGDDIDRLATFLLDKACLRLNRPPLHLSPEALDAIRHYAWPGNVRELENVIERAVILTEGTRIEAHQLSLQPSAAPAADAPGGLSLDDYTRRFIRDHEGELTETDLARRLGISRKTLWEKRQRLGIPRRR